MIICPYDVIIRGKVGNLEICTQKYHLYFPLNSQWKAFSLYLCSSMRHTFSFLRVSLKTSRNKTGKRAGTDARRRYVSQFAVVNRSAEAWNVVNNHFTGGAQEIFDLENFLSHVY